MKDTNDSFSHETGPARRPPYEDVLAGAGLRTGNLQGTLDEGSSPPRVRLIINLGCSERVTTLNAFGFGDGPEAETQAQMPPGLRMGNASCGDSRTCLSGLGRAPRAKVGSSSAPNKFLVN